MRALHSKWAGLVPTVLVMLFCRQAVQGQLAFEWGRPCTLVGTPSASQISPTCGKCGDGAMASNATKMDCTFKDITISPTSSITFSYLSKKKNHHLYIAPTVCTYTTEICPKTNGDGVARPCSYKFPSSGTFYVNDKAKEYCKEYSAHLKVTVT